MLSEIIIEQLVDRLVKRIEKGNAYVLKKMGESVREIGTLTPTEARQLAQILKYGGSYEEIARELAKITEMNVEDIYKIFEEVAKKDQQFAKRFYEYRNIDFIPYEKNTVLKRQVKALARITAQEYVNFSATKYLGFGIQDAEGNITFKGLKKAYYDLIDEAVLNVSQGKETFDSAMRRQLKSMGRGLKVISDKTYEKEIIDANGEVKVVTYHRTRRLDSALRQDMQDALRNLHNENQKLFGEEFGADGVEISVHLNPAEDHEDAQGRQFSFEEFEKLQTEGVATDYKGNVIDMRLNGDTFRPISEYNCYHYIFPIILGVSIPSHSDKELNKIKALNNKGFEYEGKKYTMYQGTQLQRKLETAIREQKDTQILARESDNKELIANAQQKITELTNKYNELCKVSGLPRKNDRLRVSGYRRVAVK